MKVPASDQVCNEGEGRAHGRGLREAYALHYGWGLL